MTSYDVSCIACHKNNGRGEPEFGRARSQAVVKVSAPSGRSLVPGGPVPLENVGLQIRDHSIGGAKADGKVAVQWEFISGAYPDGVQYELRKPDLSFGKIRLPAGVGLSLRRAPPVFGTGLLDAITADTIRSFEDPDDLNGDGISGKANLVWNVLRHRPQIGKFGWKA